MDKIQIANELLKNSIEPIKSILKEYVANMNLSITENNFELYDDWMCIDRCVSYFCSTNFNIRYWQLFEIPIDSVYCFVHTKTLQCFDLVISKDGVVIPTYIDSDSILQSANSIQEAIEKYIIPE